MLGSARGPYKKKYSSATLKSALDTIRQHGVKHGTAAKQFGIPKTTLLDRLKGRVPDEAEAGAPTVLTTSEEQKLCQFIQESSSMGFPLARNEL